VLEVPDFLEEFASSVSSKKDALKEKMLKGKPSPLANNFEKYFVANWIPLNNMKGYSINPGAFSITAVDSSVYTNLMSTGGIFYVIRSLAICKDRQQKLLDTDAIFTKASLLESQRFVGRKMEMLEFQAAIEAIKHGLDCGSILIDGSLFGRASHLPIETKIEDQQLMLLHYFETYRELLDLCKKEKIMLVGVSKESRSSFYRDYLLKLIFNEALGDLESEMDPGDLHRLKPLFAELLDKEEVARRKFAKLRQKYGKKLDAIDLIFDELSSSRPDYQLIMNHAKTPGYTAPLLLGPSAKIARRLNQCWRDPAKYVRTYFPTSARNESKDFVRWAAGVLQNLMNFPSFISFHLLLDMRDSPIRIDLLCWDHSFSKTGWPKPIDVKLDDLLKIMVTGYCGLDCYNLWLKNVDEKVRLKKRVVDTIYFPLMEKMFDAKIIRGRGYRRVRFP
jgi:hypothetical protein